MVPPAGLEPAHPKALDPKSNASTNSAREAYFSHLVLHIFYILVPDPGLEPGLIKKRILSPSRLPIPPTGGLLENILAELY